MLIIYVGSNFSLTEIDEVISNLKAAIIVVTTGGKQYTLNDGMGTKQVTRSSLKELQDSLEYWKAERLEAEGTSNVISLGGGRSDFA